MISPFRALVHFLIGALLRLLDWLWRWIALWGKLFSGLTTFALMIATLAVLMFWWSAFRSLITGLPPNVRLERLEIDAGQGEVLLGANELWQADGPNSAEPNHVALAFDPQNGWRIANRAGVRKLELTYGSIPEAAGQEEVKGWGEILTDRLLITADDQVEWSGGNIVFDRVESHRIEFTIAQGQKKRQVTIAVVQGPLGLNSGVDLTIDRFSPQSWCGGRLGAEINLLSDPLNAFPYLAARLRRALALGVNQRSEQRLLVLGGRLDCVDVVEPARLSIGDGDDLLAISYRQEQFILSRLSAVSLLVQRSSAMNRKKFRLRDRWWPVVDRKYGQLTDIIVGRTRYAVAVDPARGSQLTLAPRRNIFWFTPALANTQPDAPRIRPELAGRVRAVPSSSNPAQALSLSKQGRTQWATWLGWSAGAGLLVALMLWALSAVTGAGRGAMFFPVLAACCTGFVVGLCWRWGRGRA